MPLARNSSKLASRTDPMPAQYSAGAQAVAARASIDGEMSGFRHRHFLAVVIALAGAALAMAALAVASAEAATPTTRIVYATGKIVPIPAAIPHEAGDMVDRRIVPDLRWIAARYPIYITDGYSGPLPNGEHVGCDRCHTRHSDHYNGLAVDIVPLEGDPQCDRSWLP